MNNKPFFSIIIPVKDRAYYLKYTLQTCSIQDYENLEIIVSDDCSTDNTKEIVEEASRKDPRIKFVQPNSSQSVGMRDNFEFALNQVKPGFVIALGGDDGIMPNGINDMYEILNATGKKALAWPAPAFCYPNSRSIIGQLIIHSNKFRPRDGVKIIKSKDFIKRQITNLSYASDIESPMFYVKGVVSTEIIDKVKSKSPENRFYTCSTPDGYSGIATACELDDFAYSGRPLAIYGLSPSSQGLGYLASNEAAKKHSDAFFKKAVDIPMHSNLASQPYSPLITLMTADYLYTAREIIGWPEGCEDINIKEMLMKSINELSHGLYAENRLEREMHILYKIAEKHNLLDFYITKLNNSKRFVSKKPIEGNALSPSLLFLDANEYKITNILEAAYLAYYLHNIGSRFSFKTLYTAIKNSVLFKYKSVKRGENFPSINFNKEI